MFPDLITTRNVSRYSVLTVRVPIMLAVESILYRDLFRRDWLRRWPIAIFHEAVIVKLELDKR